MEAQYEYRLINGKKSLVPLNSENLVDFELYNNKTYYIDEENKKLNTSLLTPNIVNFFDEFNHCWSISSLNLNTGNTDNLINFEYDLNIMIWSVENGSIMPGISENISDFIYDLNNNIWHINSNNIFNVGVEPVNFEYDLNENIWNITNDDLCIGIPNTFLGAFANMTNIETLKLPDNITNLGVETFRNSSFKTISIKDGTNYEDTTFSKNTYIEKR